MSTATQRWHGLVGLPGLLQLRILEIILAGRKQHYLPQHLLRGFASSKEGKKTQVVVFKKGTPPYATSTEGVAAQRDFYSPPGDGISDTLDDVITAYERHTFNPFLDRARSALPSELLDAESSASAVVHLTVRAAFLRGTFAQLVQKVLTKVREVMTDPELLREFVDIDSKSPTSLLSAELQKALDLLPIAAFPDKERTIIEKMTRFMVREKFDTEMSKAAPWIHDALSKLESELPTVVVRGHIRALENSLVPAARLNALRSLTWKVLLAEPPNHFVLPDCAAIACSPSGRLHPVAMGSNEEIAWIAMPISAKQVLIGYSGQEPPMLPDLNKDFAACSLEFFVSSKLHSETAVLAEQVGEVLGVLAQDIIEDSFSTACHGREDSAFNSSVNNVRNVFVDVQFSTDKKNAIDESIQQIFIQQCGACEADRLESIIVTDDVAREVARLYGRALSPYETAVCETGALELIPDTVPPQFRLILPEQIIGLFFDTDIRLKRSATLLVKNMLGRLSYFDFWFRHIAPMAEGRNFTMRQRITLELTQRFASHYFGSAKACLAANESDLHESEQLAANAVITALTALKAARQKFMSQKNADVLISDVALALDILLGTLAGYCGQRSLSAKNGLLSPTSPTSEPIVRAGLWNWLTLFEKDLRQHYLSVASESSSIEQLLALSEHVERMLWHHGLFLSDVEDGGLWVDACDDERLRDVKQFLNA